MKTIAESFTAKERAEMQEAADRIAEESQRLMWDAKQEYLRAVALTLLGVVGVATVLSVIAELVTT